MFYKIIVILVVLFGAVWNNIIEREINKNLETLEIKYDLNRTVTDWSTCRNCSSRIQRKPLCNGTPCRRRHNRRKSIHMLKKIENPNSDIDDALYTKWTHWSLCSEQCKTNRRRYCKREGTCRQDQEKQEAYCYQDKTPCQTWVQLKFGNLFQLSRHYLLEVDVPRKPHRKPNRSKKFKCGTANTKLLKRSRAMRKIMGGEPAERNKWPWHVAVLNWQKKWMCGGTLVSQRWVLTAAHCLKYLMFVRVNEYDLSIHDGLEMDYYISNYLQHPNYNPLTVNNDIALLQLPQNVLLPHACLPTSAPLPYRQNCTVLGWGKKSPDDEQGPNYLHEAQLPIIPRGVCKRAYRNYYVTNKMFCAGFKNGGVDTCSGDSGGGFLCQPKGKRSGWTIQGITSFGDSCGKRGKYGIYTDVRKYVKWINYIIKYY